MTANPKAGIGELPAAGGAAGELTAIALASRSRVAPLGHDVAVGQSTIFTIFEGTSEIQRMIIGRAVTGLDV